MGGRYDHAPLHQRMRYRRFGVVLEDQRWTPTMQHLRYPNTTGDTTIMSTTDIETTTQQQAGPLAAYFPDTTDLGLDADDMEGLTPDVTRITIPAGGALAFEVPGDDPERPESLAELVGVIVHNHGASVTWLTKMSERGDEDGQPHMYSDDGVHQVITEAGRAFLAANPNLPQPSEDLASCPYAQWGSATLIDPDANPKGKATKQLRRLYIQRAGIAVPEVLTLPPTSLRPWSNYVVKQTARFGGPGKVVTRIGLDRVVNGSIKYSVANFRVVEPLPAELVAKSAEVAALIKAQKSERAPAVSTADYPTSSSSQGTSDFEQAFNATEPV